ncbi:MAG: PEP/pyruvate-binding domain-containing protein [Phycisphaeraceae bacterium]
MPTPSAPQQASRNATRWIYAFDDALPPGHNEPKALLGGKGASLAAMSRAGLRVPPGFTITTAACRHVMDHAGAWPAELEQQVRAALEQLEARTDRRFGQGPQPLLVSVRSGAAVSMPGMMDTLLNCGVHPGLADEVGDTPGFWRVYMQFVIAFAKSAAGIDLAEQIDTRADAKPSRELARQYREAYERAAGKPFPDQPWEALVQGIDAVFNSWSSERANAYRKQHNIQGLAGTAVNVQVIFPSHVSGVLFTVDPNALAAERMVVEASHGLGEAVVSGDVTPDRFLVDRNDFTRIETHLGQRGDVVASLGDETGPPDQSTLTANQLLELCELARNVETHFDAPMDIEWGWSHGQFALLQCRPIRGLDVARAVEPARQAEIARLRTLVGPGKKARRVWVAHNLGETLRTPTPLTWDIVRRFMHGSGGFGLMYRDLGYRPSADVCEHGFLELIGQRIYADPERLAGLFWDGMPLRYDLDAVLHDPGTLDRAPTIFDPERADGTFLIRLPRLVTAMFRCARKVRRDRYTAKQHFEQQVLPPYLDYIRAKHAQNLANLSTPDLIVELHDRRRRVLDQFGKESLKPGFFGGLALGELRQRLTQLMGPTEGERYTNALTTALDGDTTYEQDAMLEDVAHGRADMPEFLERFGHRTGGEMELAEPRWREDPSYLEQIATRLRKDTGPSLAERHAQNVAKRHDAERKLPDALAHHGGSAFRERIDEQLQLARTLLPYREAGKHYLMMGYELIRQAIVELGRRWDLGRDVFYLQLDELDRFEHDRDALLETLEQRKVHCQALQRLDMPNVIDSATLDALGQPPELEGADAFEGSAVSAGTAIGVARIVRDPREAGDLGEGYILVCPSTDPGWTPLFIGARGLIVERGGTLSHGAIVARDFGIPAIVCPNATRLIHSGDELRVDGNTGRITVTRRETDHA